MRGGCRARGGAHRWARVAQQGRCVLLLLLLSGESRIDRDQQLQVEVGRAPLNRWSWTRAWRRASKRQGGRGVYLWPSPLSSRMRHTRTNRRVLGSWRLGVPAWQCTDAARQLAAWAACRRMYNIRPLYIPRTRDTQARAAVVSCWYPWLPIMPQGRRSLRSLTRYLSHCCPLRTPLHRSTPGRGYRPRCASPRSRVASTSRR